jgi:hypothetical protein
VSAQLQCASIYFDLSSAFDLVLHPILLQKLCVWAFWRLRQTNRQTCLGILDTFSLPFEVLSAVTQGSVLGPLLFNIFLNDPCNVIKRSKYLPFADDVKIFRATNSVDDCILPQSDIERTHGQCAANFMKQIISKTTVIAFTRKTDVFVELIKCGSFL